MSIPNAFLSSNKQDYSTPWPLVKQVEKEIGGFFSLDVCATEKTTKAPNFYTEEEDAFTKNWGLDAANSGLAWCNPPYANGMPEKFLRHAMAEKAKNGLTTVFLFPANKTDQIWWHNLVIPKHAVWDVRGRVNFLDPDTGAVPVIWKSREVLEEETGVGCLVDPLYGRWVKQSNPQASKIVIVGPNHGPCFPKSFTWR